MRQVIFSLLAVVVLAGCASKAGVATDEVIAQWTQRPDEIGKLPIGKVVSIAKAEFKNNVAPLQPSIYSAQAALAIVMVADIVNSARSSGIAYRHVVQMKDGGKLELDTLHSFKLGQCIAFRPGLQDGAGSAIPAISSECNW